MMDGIESVVLPCGESISEHQSHAPFLMKGLAIQASADEAPPDLGALDMSGGKEIAKPSVNNSL